LKEYKTLCIALLLSLFLELIIKVKTIQILHRNHHVDWLLEMLLECRLILNWLLSCSYKATFNNNSMRFCS